MSFVADSGCLYREVDQFVQHRPESPVGTDFTLNCFQILSSDILGATFPFVRVADLVEGGLLFQWITVLDAKCSRPHVPDVGQMPSEFPDSFLNTSQCFRCHM